jgi:hypothetical protein
MTDRDDRRLLVVLTGTALVLGVAGGLLWPWLAPRQTFLITVAGPFPESELSAGRVVSADAWFAVMSAVAGLLLGLLAALSKSRRAPTVVVGAVSGSMFEVAVMFVVGQVVANHRLVLRWAPVGGENLPQRGLLVLQAWPVLALGPLLAVVVTLVAVALSSPPEPAGAVGGPPVA